MWDIVKKAGFILVLAVFLTFTSYQSTADPVLNTSNVNLTNISNDASDANLAIILIPYGEPAITVKIDFFNCVTLQRTYITDNANSFYRHRCLYPTRDTYYENWETLVRQHNDAVRPNNFIQG